MITTYYLKAKRIYNIIKNEEEPALILQAAQEIYNGHYKAQKLFDNFYDDIDGISKKLEQLEGKKK